MNTSDPRHIEAAKAAFIREFNRQHLRTGLLLGCMLAIVLVVYRGLPPPWNGVGMACGSAIYMTGFLMLRPDSLRSRTGSRLPAIGLVSFLWLIAILSLVVALLGQG